MAGSRRSADSFWPTILFGSDGALIEIEHAATGFLHVRKEVYEEVESRLDLPTCNASTDSPFVPFFLPMVVEKDGQYAYLGEDYAFSERVRRSGFKIVADTRIRLKHFGELDLGGKMQEVQSLDSSPISTKLSTRVKIREANSS